MYINISRGIQSLNSWKEAPNKHSEIQLQQNSLQSVYINTCNIINESVPDLLRIPNSRRPCADRCGQATVRLSAYTHARYLGWHSCNHRPVTGPDDMQYNTMQFSASIHSYVCYDVSGVHFSNCISHSTECAQMYGRPVRVKIIIWIILFMIMIKSVESEV